MPSPSTPYPPSPSPRKTRVSSINIPSPDADLHHRAPLTSTLWLPPPKEDFGQTLPIMNALSSSQPASSSNSPTSGLMPNVALGNDPHMPLLCGLPLKYVSLLTLALQNALLTIIMHYSRVSASPSQSYSAASAVLVNELLKGGISLVIALLRIDADMSRTSPTSMAYTFDANGVPQTPLSKSKKLSIHGLNGPPVTASENFYRAMHFASPARWMSRLRRLRRDVFSNDCWKLSIPAILYVIQNNLQFVAASNLDVATFQVTYQMKILTTAAFSVMLLRRKLSATRWLALLFLAIGVGIVQIQSGAGKPSSAPPPQFAAESVDGEVVEEVVREVGHTMNRLKGFMAVCAACMTSGLAGVYFEMVLKNSQADLWVRNVQLSLFSLVPALVPVFFTSDAGYPEQGWLSRLFRNFTPWAWATVWTQVAGGLVTAIVIKHADNILKGFATSISIIISFLASVVLFGFHVTPAFLVGSTTVLGATWMYNQPSAREREKSSSAAAQEGSNISLLSTPTPPRRPSFPGSPIGPDAPILGQTSASHSHITKQRSPYSSPSSLALALGISSSTTTSRPTSTLPSPLDRDYFGSSSAASSAPQNPQPPPLYPHHPPLPPPPPPPLNTSPPPSLPPPPPPSRPPSRPNSTRPPTRPPSRPSSARPSLQLAGQEEAQAQDLAAIDEVYVPRSTGADVSPPAYGHHYVPPPILVDGSGGGGGGEGTKLVRR